MKVKIRSWKSMEKEYGLDLMGNVKCDHRFVVAMSPFCDQEIKVYKDNSCIVREVNTNWAISKDMIEKKYHKEFEKLYETVK